MSYISRRRNTTPTMEGGNTTPILDDPMEEEENWIPTKQQKYTRDKDGQGQGDCGWSREGKLRFNKLMTRLAHDHVNNPNVEKTFLKRMEEVNKNDGCKKRKCTQVEEPHVEMLTSKEVMQSVMQERTFEHSNLVGTTGSVLWAEGTVGRNIITDKLGGNQIYYYVGW